MDAMRPDFTIPEGGRFPNQVMNRGRNKIWCRWCFQFHEYEKWASGDGTGVIRRHVSFDESKGGVDREYVKILCEHTGEVMYYFEVWPMAGHPKWDKVDSKTKGLIP